MPEYDFSKTIVTNLQALFRWVYTNTNRTKNELPQADKQNANDILQAEADDVEAVCDELNAILEV